MAKELFNVAVLSERVQIKWLAGGNVQIGVQDDSDVQWFDISEQHLEEAANVLCDALEEAFPRV
jgi:hypothetical protein